MTSSVRQRPGNGNRVIFRALNGNFQKYLLEPTAAPARYNGLSTRATNRLNSFDIDFTRMCLSGAKKIFSTRPLTLTELFLNCGKSTKKELLTFIKEKRLASSKDLLSTPAYVMLMGLVHSQIEGAMTWKNLGIWFAKNKDWPQTLEAFYKQPSYKLAIPELTGFLKRKGIVN